MKRAWVVRDPPIFSMMEHNILLVEFTTELDLLRILNKGIWNYRGEVVALQRVRDQSDILNPSVTHMEMWTQMHRIPHRIVSNEGIKIIAQSVAPTLSQVSETFVGGSKHYKVKLKLPIDLPLPEIAPAHHPLIGDFKVYLVYERLSRICMYCSKVGHDHTDCPDKLRMESLSLDPRYSNRPEMQGITEPRVGKWINDSTMLPNNDTNSYTPQQPQNYTTNTPQYTNPQPATPTDYQSDPQPIQSQQQNGSPIAPQSTTDQLRSPYQPPHTRTPDLNYENAQSWASTGDPLEQQSYQPDNHQSTNPTTNRKVRQFVNSIEARETSHARKKRVMEATHVPPPGQI